MSGLAYDTPVFTENSQTDEISLDVWKIKMADKIEQEGS